ncbi:hypothetical protein AABM38_12520 [Heyndrickxia sp. MSNUG]|uniref:hypothetical protein n=1 Tax=Heyndrickxia sp. MSNUG TaxID=3136677 RepID=UPI003C2FE436
MNDKLIKEMNKIEIPRELRERSKIGVEKAKREVPRSNKQWYIFAAPALAAAVALSIAGPGLLSNNSPENPVIKTVEYNNTFDVSDPNRLVGWADSVFIGKVVEQSGTKSLAGLPETQFKVEVMDTIKGDIKGTVIVNQQGGYEGNELILVENDPLLENGKSYLFITKYLKDENWHTLVPVYGDIEITNESQKQELIEKYQKAYQEQIPFE